MHAQEYKETIKFFLDECPHLAVLGYGHSGIGKSEIPVQVAAEAKVPVIYLDCTGMEPTDLLGLPDKDDSDYTRYKSPSWFKPAVTEPAGILILDEVTRLDLQVRHTLMQTLVRREIGEIKLNPGWLIVMTANPADEEYQVAELDVAYRRRSVIVPVSFNADVWRNWAIFSGVHPRIIGASARLAGGLNKAIDKEIKQTLTPYGLKAASDLIKAGVLNLGNDLSFQILTGAVGDTAAKAIIQSINDEKLQRLMALAMDCKPLGPLAHDEAIALICAFWEKVHKQAKKFAPQIKSLYDQLNVDIRMMLVKLCYDDMLKHGEEFKELTDAWSDWCTKQTVAQQERERKRREVKREKGQ